MIFLLVVLLAAVGLVTAEPTLGWRDPIAVALVLIALHIVAVHHRTGRNRP